MRKSAYGAHHNVRRELSETLQYDWILLLWAENFMGVIIMKNTDIMHSMFGELPKHKSTTADIWRGEFLMSDLIDRRAAIDAFGLSEKTRKYGGDHSGYDTRMLYEIQDVLEGLPSAQPDRSLWFRIGEICVDESNGFISAGRAIEKIRGLLREAERREE